MSLFPVFGPLSCLMALSFVSHPLNPTHVTCFLSPILLSLSPNPYILYIKLSQGSLFCGSIPVFVSFAHLLSLPLFLGLPPSHIQYTCIPLEVGAFDGWLLAGTVQFLYVLIVAKIRKWLDVRNKELIIHLGVYVKSVKI
jgi:hypothetical protein